MVSRGWPNKIRLGSCEASYHTATFAGIPPTQWGGGLSPANFVQSRKEA
jgi:hypothetical protein